MNFFRQAFHARLVRFAGATALVCLMAIAATAVTLEEYRNDIVTAKDLSSELLEYTYEVGTEDDRDAEYELELKDEFLEALPSSTKVEIDGATVETDNAWLGTALDAYIKEKSIDERQKIAAAIYERIEAIEAKITPNGTTAGASSKDEEKRRLAEILRREEFQKPAAKEESWFERFQRKLREWLSSKMPRPPEIPAGATSGFQSISYLLQIGLYVVVLGFIAFLIYRFAPFFSDRIKRREKRVKKERIVLGETIAADVDSQSLLDEADALARTGNLRGAIRKGYIAFLCELSDRSIIGLAQHKTNRDYLRDVRKRDGLFQGMRGLTNSFERHWYGFENADETAWNEFKQIYRDSLSREK